MRLLTFSRRTRLCLSCLISPVLSSTLFVATNNMTRRPLIILNKTLDKYKSIYNAIIENTDKVSYNNIYLHYNDVPENVRILVDAHMK